MEISQVPPIPEGSFHAISAVEKIRKDVQRERFYSNLLDFSYLLLQLQFLTWARFSPFLWHKGLKPFMILLDYSIDSYSGEFLFPYTKKTSLESS